MGKTNIQWTWPVLNGVSYQGITWNPSVGCTRVSAGCDHCYAFDFHDRRMYLPWKRGNNPTAPVQYHQPFSKVQLLPERLDDPLHWKAPRCVFVDSMSDLFHEDVPDAYIWQVFGIMRRTPQHIYEILTKRPERMQKVLRELTNAHALKMLGEHDYMQQWPLPNVWLGTSVENQAAADERIPYLLDTPAAIRFLSCEPLLGPVDLWYPAFSVIDRYGEPSSPRCERDGSPVIKWVIVGGESGKFARPMDLRWARNIQEECNEAGVALFMKQLGGVWATQNHAKHSHGALMEEWPTKFQVRQFPTPRV